MDSGRISGAFGYDRERGHYVDPKAYNQPEERGIDWFRNRLA